MQTSFLYIAIALQPARLENSRPDAADFREFMTARSKKIYSLLGLFLLSAGAFAKALPPEQELADAESALRVADEREAKVYAPVERGFAEDKLVRARAAVEEKDMKLAKRLALEAEVDAELAATRSRLQKARELVETRTEENRTLRRDLLGGEQP